MAVNDVKLTQDDRNSDAFDDDIESWITFILCHNLSADEIAYKFHRGTIKKICQYLGLRGDASTTEAQDSIRLESFLKAPCLYEKRIELKKN